jgi:hypothetical protein
MTHLLPQEMTREELLKLHERSKQLWKDEAAWYQKKLRERNDDTKMKQIRHLLVENHQLHRELEQAREREEGWLAVKVATRGYPQHSKK